MNKWKTIWLGAVAILAAPAATAQDSERDQARAEAAREQAEIALEQARKQEAIERERQLEVREVERVMERKAVDIEVEMREAETRMAEAARRIAELSTRQLPSVSGSYWSTKVSGKPVLGVTIGAPDDAGPVEGVEVLGVSPGAAAGEAGLRAGDVITAVNDESLSADNSGDANQKLLDFMSAIEEGDVIDVEYLRAGKSGTVELAPRPMSPQMFAFGGPDHDFHVEVPPAAPGAPRAEVNRFVFVTGNQGWGDMEMVKLTESLGRYFGTDEGLLVVRAPEDENFKLQDGDVILDIDGRKPNSVPHAIRILGSYQHGESLEIRIMRDKRARTLAIKMPDNRRGAVFEPRIKSTLRAAPKVQPAVKIRAADERI